MKKITFLLFTLIAFTLQSNAQVMVSNSPALAITDNTPAGVTDVITVGATTGTVTDVTVDLTITHTWVGDLIVTLESPAGQTTQVILDRAGYFDTGFGCQENNIVTTLSDAGGTAVEDVCIVGDPAIDAGPYQAHDGTTAISLATAFSGDNATGDWTLTVSDNAGGDTGTLDSWGMSIFGPTLGLDNNVIEGFTYSPNPVVNKLNLTAAQNIDNVVVYNILGQQVMRAMPNAVSNDLDMSSLNSGAYFIKVSVGDVTQTVRVLKQ